MCIHFKDVVYVLFVYIFGTPCIIDKKLNSRDQSSQGWKEIPWFLNKMKGPYAVHQSPPFYLRTSKQQQIYGPFSLLSPPNFDLPWSLFIFGFLIKILYVFCLLQYHIAQHSVTFSILPLHPPSPVQIFTPTTCSQIFLFCLFSFDSFTN